MLPAVWNLIILSTTVGCGDPISFGISVCLLLLDLFFLLSVFVVFFCSPPCARVRRVISLLCVSFIVDCNSILFFLFLRLVSALGRRVQMAFWQNRSISLVDMYIDNSEPTENVGQIHFSLEYDFQNTTLILKIMQVSLLQSTGFVFHLYFTIISFDWPPAFSLIPFTQSSNCPNE